MTYLCYPQQVSLAHAPPLLSFPISANADRHEVFRYPDRSGIQASVPMFRSKKFPTFRSMQLVAFKPVFPVSRPKWHSDQFSGIQTEVAFRPVFRYPDRSGIQASVPMFRSKKFPTFRSMQLVAFRPVFRYSDRSGIQANFPIFRSKWHSGQFSDVQIEEGSDVQVDATCGIQAHFPMFRSKSFPVFRLMSGIQAMVISVLPFILSINTEVSVEENTLGVTLGDSLEKEGREAKHSEVSLEQNPEEKDSERKANRVQSSLQTLKGTQLVNLTAGDISGFLAPLTAIASDLYPCGSAVPSSRTAFLPSSIPNPKTQSNTFTPSTTGEFTSSVSFPSFGMNNARWRLFCHSLSPVVFSHTVFFRLRQQLYQQRMKRAFDRKVQPRVYHVGDLVLKRILPPQNDGRGKWTPNYEGPFMVKKVFSGGALLLTTMDSEDFPSPVNAEAVKKYFV
ncbi:hypothetical protein KIW84_074715 [Lathyrus oleraceus]|uniref:Uncharacterized protein n=1 Tax=Pisum sativum TaxID=3888 RepID=A0A9D5A0X2_PEA|nr:hypothetical protein KIW84_074715 [Pisum sativum]